MPIGPAHRSPGTTNRCAGVAVLARRRGCARKGWAAPRRPPDLTTIAQREGGTFRLDDLVRYRDGRSLTEEHPFRTMPEWGALFEEATSGDPDAAAKARERLHAIAIYLWKIQR
jgi:hypothetical protein